MYSRKASVDFLCRLLLVARYYRSICVLYANNDCYSLQTQPPVHEQGDFWRKIITDRT